MPEHSLNPCEHDFDAIEAAVMETSRGRWFLAEYQRRNRSADTKLVLGALSKIDGKLNVSPTPASAVDTSYLSGISEINGAIETLHRDLALLQKRGAHSITANASSLTALVELDNSGAGKLAGAIESLREVSWTMREVGTNPEFCNTIDAMTAEISAACGVDDTSTKRVSKLVGTIDYVQQRLNKITAEIGLHSTTTQTSPALSDPLALFADENVEIPHQSIRAAAAKMIAPAPIEAQPIAINPALLSLPHIHEALKREWAQETTTTLAPEPIMQTIAPPILNENVTSLDFSGFSFEEKLALFS